MSPTCMRQIDGKAQSGPDLSVTHFSGLKLPNPFVIGSGEDMPVYYCNSWPSYATLSAGRCS